jgi:16S rRNA (adenine1518-N6/adenine1519-N6)-dimethyltransferase
VVANLPYYITGAVIRHFLEASLKPRLMVLMVQREVAKQITAKPGEMSLLSVSVQVYGVPKIAAKVPAHAFYPTPKVDSAVLRIDVYPQPKVAVNNVDEFFRLVKAGFSANRKQLINSLSHGLDLPKTDVLPFLEKAGIDPKRRAETLTIEEWRQLLNIFRERGAHDNH